MTTDTLNDIADAGEDLNEWLSTPEGAYVAHVLGQQSASDAFLNIYKIAQNRAALRIEAIKHQHFPTT